MIAIKRIFGKLELIVIGPVFEMINHEFLEYKPKKTKGEGNASHKKKVGYYLNEKNWDIIRPLMKPIIS